jgi:hypothetical protein
LAVAAKLVSKDPDGALKRLGHPILPDRAVLPAVSPVFGRRFQTSEAMPSPSTFAYSLPFDIDKEFDEASLKFY